MTSGGSKCWKRDLEQKFGKEGCDGVSMSRLAMVKHGGSCVFASGLFVAWYRCKTRHLIHAGLRGCWAKDEKDGSRLNRKGGEEKGGGGLQK